MNPLPYTYLDGKIIPVEEANINILTAEFQYGCGCFEGIRGYYLSEKDAINIFRFDTHLKRLYRSCSVLYLNPTESFEALNEIVEKLIRINKYEGDTYIRITVYRSTDEIIPKILGLSTGMAIYLYNISNHNDNDDKGLSLGISSWRKISSQAMPMNVKSIGMYLNAILARTEAQLRGFDDAVLLNHEGKVAEGSVHNIFIVREGHVVTPPLSAGILDGITRDTVLNICRKILKIPVEEKNISRSELYTADEIFITGTATEIARVTSIDDINLPDESITQRIKDIYKQLVHLDMTISPDWSHIVELSKKSIVHTI